VPRIDVDELDLRADHAASLSLAAPVKPHEDARMTKHLLALAIVLAPGVAAANVPNSFGLGVEYQINGTGGVAADYDVGKFDFGGFFGLVDLGTTGSRTGFALGGRFFYHLHSTPSTDFGVGGSIGLDSVPVGATDRNNLVFLEPSFQIRWFPATNLALSFAGGIVIGVADANGVAIAGQTVSTGGAPGTVGGGAGAGIMYYFN
jgi:hypothetical protein